MTEPGRITRLAAANRGEPVVRIARTCRALGIVAVALVTEDQEQDWWQAPEQVDGRVALHGTYLDADAVLDAARRARADAIHPGWGYLAENASFARAVESAGMAWVGPPPEAMERLGDKASARHLASELGLPLLPGYDAEEQSDDRLASEAERIGYPVLLKPSAGGGGKGMHVVAGSADLPEALARARREAKAAFGDERLIVERYLARPRHVEIQVLFDAHGNGVHLGERDCSLQRRHQKVIEESPSPAVDAALRERLGEAALRLASAGGYANAGTVEFLLADDGSFYFMEMNTRLQVEHPVTELVTGRDLVADQLRVAAGEPLGFGQDDVRLEGHAIEARIYAEDPWSGFLPATGSLGEIVWPAGDGVRVDAGAGSFEDVGTRYDPMLAKVLAHAETRDVALERLVAALRAMSLPTVTTNRGFLATLLEDEEVRRGDARTDTIERVSHPDPATPSHAWEAAARTLADVTSSDRETRWTTSRPGFRLNAKARLSIRSGTTQRAVEISRAPAFPTEVESRLGERMRDRDVYDQQIGVDVDGRWLRFQLAPPPTVETALEHAAAAGGGASRVVAPMPGTVLAVRVAEGDLVEAHQVLVVLEAMKMENAVTAPADGRVTNVRVTEGQQVQRDDILVELE